MGEPHPLAVVLSGPSGAGKDAVLQDMRQKGYPAHYTVTCTTRPRRLGEKEGQDYHFVSPEEFQAMKESQELLEWAKVYGHYYGVPRQPVKEALERGQDVLIKVDVQGAATIKKLLPQAVFIFLTPPSMEELTSRLKKRKSEAASDLALRLKTVEEEMAHLSSFDYAVVNRRDRLDEAVSQIEAIIIAEKCRTYPRVVEL
jgi:guanylate kinase